ncbi:hypothetical protein EYF80_000200 [Liparis tanakae]|uniref:Uncharacterized protein n=1 Tax=Liparis tanakae TaxID=230148 RepID=A0A4Z2JI00_9TELE|nr:hypothetical protein EYF80_000200 [Liparis tanakae]
MSEDDTRGNYTRAATTCRYNGDIFFTTFCNGCEVDEEINQSARRLRASCSISRPSGTGGAGGAPPPPQQDALASSPAMLPPPTHTRAADGPLNCAYVDAASLPSVHRRFPRLSLAIIVSCEGAQSDGVERRYVMLEALALRGEPPDFLFSSRQFHSSSRGEASMTLGIIVAENDSDASHYETPTEEILQIGNLDDDERNMSTTL